MNIGRPRVVVPVLLAAAVVWMVWPRAADADVRAAYARLRGSPVPPLLVGYTLPRDTRADVSSDGYALSGEVAGLGRVSLVGRAGASAAAPGDFHVRGQPAQVSVVDGATRVSWQEGGAVYSLSVPGQPDTRTLEAVTQRVVPLADAERDAFGFPWDTPLLYALYLPLFVVFLGWAGGRLLSR